MPPIRDSESCQETVPPPTRRRKLRAALTLSAVVLLGGLAWLVFNSLEGGPVYQGKPLSFWLDFYSPRMSRSPVADFKKANAAVVAVGTNAIPKLLRMLRAKDTPMRLRVAKFLQAQERSSLWPSAIKGALTRIHVVPAADLNSQAALGLQVLGKDALSAVPAVIEIYEARISPSSERWATYTLGAIGGEQAFFALLRGTTNSNSQTRQNCLIALPGAHAEPELTVWALTNAFADPDAEVRLWACNRLGLVGREAYEARAKAMPALDKLLQDPNASVRVEADAVLKKVQAQ